ncbi:hypothetical protein V1517DRAFT_315156 [Lipomyces orientalis]|uniref:Uncharacterized protein n=1 Tax=Lipomyces orientalis TaxID=1233043 RepID=A0ACC3TWA5_9ASCO
MAILRPTILADVTYQRIVSVLSAVALIFMSAFFVQTMMPSFTAQQSHDACVKYNILQSHLTRELLPDTPAPYASHLIIVAGHAIWKGQPGIKAGEEASEWNLKEFQVGQQATFIKHIEMGVNLGLADQSALVVFSGGQTDRSAGPLSEAQSYWNLAMARSIISDANKEFSVRMLTEEFARDSYENLLFSICRFYEFTGLYPQKITVISHKFKSHRFDNLHRVALRYPKSSFKFLGINPSGEEPTESERINAVEPFQQDPYACSHPTLMEKKMARNPFRRRSPYIDSCPQLYGLFTYCTLNDTFYEGPLPWDMKTPYTDDEI